MDAKTGLAKVIGLREAITLTVGTVIGVGLFTVGSNVVGTLGKWTILATMLALLVSIYPALIYAEMAAALPNAGGTYHFAKRSIGTFWGMQAGWNFIISLIAVASGEALAFAFYFKTFFEAINLPLAIDDRIIAVLAISIFIFINYRGVKLSGKIQNGLMFFFWGVAIVWAISMMGHINWEHFNAVIPLGAEAGGITVASFITMTGLVWWCFAGFETCCAMGSEIRYPQINIPRALILAPFIIFIVTATFQWFLVGIVSPENLHTIIEADAPYAQAMKQAGILGFPLILLCLGITFGGDFSTLNPAIAAPARYLFTMAQDGVLPKIFSKIHPRYKSPYAAIIFIGVIVLALVSTNSIIFIASLSLFADLFYYLIGLVASIFLRTCQPHIKRPFRLKGLIPAAIVSVLIYLIFISQLDRDAFVSGAIWFVIGSLIYLYAKLKNRIKPIEEDPEQTTPSVPTPQEKKSMDREFFWWRNIVFTLFVAVLALYGISYL